MPQVQRFGESKGCVIHKIMLTPRGKASAWFDHYGTMIGVEYFPHAESRRTHPVKRGGPLWHAIEQAARPHLPK